MKKLRRLLKFSVLLVTSYWLLVTIVNADTIYTNDGKEIKGIVVEDYKDRLVFSTPDGEIMLMKSDIRELYIDSEEDNLIKLAEQAFERKDYARSYSYYDKAHKLNPDSSRAKDGLVYVRSYLYRQGEAAKMEAIRRQAEFEKSGKAVIRTEYAEEEETRIKEEKLKNSLGFTLTLKDGFPEVDNIGKDSPASQAGISKGDLIVSIWGRLTGYMSLIEVIDRLLERSSFEIKCLIERTVRVDISDNRNILSGPKELIGAELKMEFDGLTITEVTRGDTDLRKDDLITAIDGKSTRYMPIKQAIEMIKNSKGKDIKLTIRREVVIWRKG
ncbi:MAG: PDZ domain-containing protein [Candidatus Omnitrophica bacterium]|nr:PDZ domain-containing protein [Candidatus Omnitrophota bacterium]